MKSPSCIGEISPMLSLVCEKSLPSKERILLLVWENSPLVLEKSPPGMGELSPGGEIPPGMGELTSGIGDFRFLLAQAMFRVSYYIHASIQRRKCPPGRKWENAPGGGRGRMPSGEEMGECHPWENSLQGRGECPP